MTIESIGVYVALFSTAAIAFWAIWKSLNLPKKDSNSEDASYFTARGMLTKSRLFFSVFATTFSAFTVVGLPAMFYAHGVGTFIWMGVGIALTPLILHLVGKRIVRRAEGSKAGSAIGLIASGYGSRSLMLILSLVTVIVLFPYLTLQIAGIGKFLLSTSDGNLSYFYGTAFVCIIVGLYVSTGGAAADAETDFIQGPILLLGTFALGGFLIFEMWGSFSETWSSLDSAGLLSLPGPNGYFTPSVLISFGIIFTLISISTPQVSQRIMGSKAPEDLSPLIKIYAPVGLTVVALAGLMGLYAAANLDIASPDFVAGDVLRSMADNASGVYLVAYNLIAILFITAVISAAVSTVDSLLISIAGIASDNVDELKPSETKHKLKIVSWLLLGAGLLFSANPPTFIVDLARIQLAGLTALLPCLMGPLFGFDRKLSGWLALVLGLAPIFIVQLTPIKFAGIDAGVVGLGAGSVGLLIGHYVSRSKK